MTKRVVVVEDEPGIASILQAYLEREGYHVTVFHDGGIALDAIRANPPDLILLDLMLPGVSGWDVCRDVRRRFTIPIIMLTARDEISDKITGLELGADDYVTKPFDPKEVVSRVKAVLRRTENRMVEDNDIVVGDLTIDPQRRLIRCRDRQIELTPMEFELLSVLAETPGRVFSRQQLLDKVQGDAYEGYERTIDSHIKNIRKKIESNLKQSVRVVSVYGIGYKLVEN